MNARDKKKHFLHPPFLFVAIAFIAIGAVLAVFGDKLRYGLSGMTGGYGGGYGGGYYG